MPQKPSRKREYNRLRQRRLRGYGTEGDRSLREGGLSLNVVPPLEKRDVVPLNPRTMTKRQLVGYLEHAGRRGFTLTLTTKGYALVAAGTGQVVPFDAVFALEHTLSTQNQRITQLEADLARLEAMIDSMLRETAS